jgi:hypothetical protein
MFPMRQDLELYTIFGSNAVFEGLKKVSKQKANSGQVDRVKVGTYLC